MIMKCTFFLQMLLLFPRENFQKIGITILVNFLDCYTVITSRREYLYTGQNNSSGKIFLKKGGKRG